MPKSGLRPLWMALDFKLSEVLRIDFGLGFAAGVGAFFLGMWKPSAAVEITSVAASVVGVVVGAVIAGIAVQSAFMDEAFLRKIRAIGKDPAYYLAPFLFTVLLGVIAMLLLLALSACPLTLPAWIIAIVSAHATFFTVWTVTSLLPGLSTLVQFLGLKTDALDVPDDLT